MKKLLLAFLFCLFASTASAQNVQCADRPSGDSSNACANTRFVQSAGIGNISAALDTIGSTEGDVLYRGPSVWAALPPGTTNYCLTTQGPGAAPIWQSCPAGSGSVGFVQDYIAGTDFTPGTTTSLTVANPPTAAVGMQVYFDGVNQSSNTWSLSGSTVTFNSAIPSTIQVVEIHSVTTTSAGCSIFNSSTSGCVPASGGGTTNFLRADGTWTTPAGSLQVFNPQNYGAAGDGVTDDTAAWASMCSAINTAGGGWIVPPSGKTYLIFSSTSSLQSATMCSIASLNFFHLDMNGSKFHSKMSGQINIGGAATAGDVLGIEISSLYGTFASQSLSITVTSGETTAQMATALAAAINANSTLTANSIAATSSGGTVNFTPTGAQNTWWIGVPPGSSGVGMACAPVGAACTETIAPSLPVVFQFVNSQNITINDLNGTADSFIAENGPNGSSVNWIGCSNASSSTGFSCRNFAANRVSLNGGYQGFFIVRSPGTGTQGYNIHVDGNFTNIGYPMSNQFDGWNTDFRINTINAGRSYIGYNTSGVKGVINSYRPGFSIGLQDCDVTAYGFGANQFVDLSQNTTSNFDLTYINRLSTYYGNAFFNLSHQQADPANSNIPTEISNITFRSDIYLHNSPTVGFLAMQAFKGNNNETPGDVSGDQDNNIIITGSAEGTWGTSPNACALSATGAYCQGFSSLAVGTYHIVDFFGPQLKWSQGVNAEMTFENYSSSAATIPAQDAGTPTSALVFRPPVAFNGLTMLGLSCSGINASTFTVIQGGISHC